MLRLLLIALCAIGVIDAASVRADTPSDLDCRKSFAAGQEWSLPSNNATVVIGRVEDWRDQTAVHVSILNIKIPPGSAGTIAMTEIAHVPFSCDALKGSVAKLMRTNAAPLDGFEAGYKQWQDAKGGLFTIGVGEVLDLVLKKSPGI
jgi:hypothetical protein